MVAAAAPALIVPGSALLRLAVRHQLCNMAVLSISQETQAHYFHISSQIRSLSRRRHGNPLRELVDEQTACNGLRLIGHCCKHHSVFKVEDKGPLKLRQISTLSVRSPHDLPHAAVLIVAAVLSAVRRRCCVDILSQASCRTTALAIPLLPAPRTLHPAGFTRHRCKCAFLGSPKWLCKSQ